MISETAKHKKGRKRDEENIHGLGLPALIIPRALVAAPASWAQEQGGMMKDDKGDMMKDKMKAEKKGQGGTTDGKMTMDEKMKMDEKSNSLILQTVRSGTRHVWRAAS